VSFPVLLRSCSCRPSRLFFPQRERPADPALNSNRSRSSTPTLSNSASMTRSFANNKKEYSRHSVPASNVVKKHGHGHLNWGSIDDEVQDGLIEAQFEHEAKSVEQLGMSKLSTSPSSTSSSGSPTTTTFASLAARDDAASTSTSTSTSDF